MSRYLLDTNAVIALLNSRDSAIARHLRQCSPEALYVSSIVLHELYYGAFKSRRVAHNTALVDQLQFEVLTFDQEDARQAGCVRAQLSKQGTPIGPCDVLIAGQAKAREMILVTRNLDEFKRVQGLRCEDWEASFG